MLGRLVTRTWMAEGGCDGPGWSRAQIDAFREAVNKASRKVKGRPILITAWAASPARGRD